MLLEQRKHDKSWLVVIKSIGLDIVEISRIERDVEKFGDRFVDRILGPDERSIYEQRRDKSIFLAGRFAAKEAVIKALGVLLTERPPYSALQILPDEANMPRVSLPDELGEQVKPATLLISITHERSYAAAVALLSEEK